MPLVTIGLTGPTGAGKSSLRPVFERSGFAYIDTDLIAREVVTPPSPLLKRLAEEFGSDLINPDGTLNRALTAQRAFATSEAQARLNGLTHPAITAQTQELIALAKAQGLHALVDAPLLFEAGMEKICYRVIAVLAQRERRIARIIERDSISRDVAESRMARQHDDEFYFSRADYVLYNNGTEEELIASAQLIVDRILDEYNK